MDRYILEQAKERAQLSRANLQKLGTTITITGDSTIGCKEIQKRLFISVTFNGFDFNRFYKNS